MDKDVVFPTIPFRFPQVGTNYAFISVFSNLEASASSGNQVQPSSESKMISFGARSILRVERTCSRPWQTEAR